MFRDFVFNVSLKMDFSVLDRILCTIFRRLTTCLNELSRIHAVNSSVREFQTKIRGGFGLVVLQGTILLMIAVGGEHRMQITIVDSTRVTVLKSSGKSCSHQASII